MKYLLCLLILSVVILAGCTSKYSVELPVINKIDLEPGLYRMNVIGYSQGNHRFQWVSTYIPAEAVPNCERIEIRNRITYCVSTPVRVIFNPQPWFFTANGKVLIENHDEIVVRITKKLGEKFEKLGGYEMRYYVYEGIPVKSLTYPDVPFEFEEARE